VQTADGGREPVVPLPADVFKSWPADRAPDVVFVLTGQEYGYLSPCGCSRPQLGGLERRYNFIEAVRARGWNVVPVDLGDVMYRKGIDEQALLKYDVAMKAREKMGYAAVGIGAHDAELPLLDALARFPLQNPAANPRVLAANLVDREKNFPLDGDRKSLVGTWEYVPAAGKGPAVGVVACVGPSVRDQIKDPSVRLGSNAEALKTALAEMAARTPPAEARVLLYQGKPEEAQSAAGAFAGQFQVVLALSSQEEPPAVPVYLDAKGAVTAKPTEAATMIASVGHKARHIGVAALYRTGEAGRPWELHYELVSMGEEFETPEAKKDGHPILGLMEGYTRQLRDEDFLSKQVKRPHPTQTAHPTEKISFVGSLRCQTCHPAEYAIWEKTKHAEAYPALVGAKHPSLRQFDNQCIVCHTVGFDYQEGFLDQKRTPHLMGVGCESCHGPGSAHVANPRNDKFRATQSPWKAKPGDALPEKSVLSRVDAVCQKCHDTDNDPHFRFEQYWPKIAHGSAKKPE
jgi:hypothetical protein